MRSIARKLTLAFLAVALLSVGVVAVVMGGLAQREFDRFVANRDQLDLADRAADYYAANGSWAGLAANPGGRLPSRMPMGRQEIWLLDAQGETIIGPRDGHGQTPSEGEQPSLPITVDGEVVGTLVFEENPLVAGLRQPLEQAYVSAVNRAILLSAVLATALALALGAFLAYTIARPVRELTEATRAVAGGDLGRQVPVRTRDELGELGLSFNQMSADLDHAKQARQQMTADIAHDLRTPLSVILGYTEALSDGKLQGNPAMYDAMHGQSLHLSRLIDDLRTLSLADAHELSLQTAELSPCTLLAQTAAAYRPQAEQQGIELRTECPASCPAVLADADRMMQVLGNLVSNALRHTPGGGQIVLSAVPGRDDVAISVRDTGHGIATEDLPFIFERFYRGDKARQADGASGLGLAIARSLVETQGGRITVEPAPGQGTVFTLTLPQPPA
jgi:signal transduction histidine kinase